MVAKECVHGVHHLSDEALDIHSFGTLEVSVDVLVEVHDVHDDRVVVVVVMVGGHDVPHLGIDALDARWHCSR